MIHMHGRCFEIVSLCHPLWRQRWEVSLVSTEATQVNHAVTTDCPRPSEGSQASPEQTWAVPLGPGHRRVVPPQKCPKAYWSTGSPSVTEVWGREGCAVRDRHCISSSPSPQWAPTLPPTHTRAMH